MNTETQTLAIQRHLAKGNRIRPLEALRRWKCMRLGARIYDLKELGWKIPSRYVTTRGGKRVKEYWFDRATGHAIRGRKTRRERMHGRARR